MNTTTPLGPHPAQPNRSVVGEVIKEQKWKLKTNISRPVLVHLYVLGADKTLCGRPQENYDTEEGLYSLEYFKDKVGRAACKQCIKIASKPTQP